MVVSGKTSNALMQVDLSYQTLDSIVFIIIPPTAPVRLQRSEIDNKGLKARIALMYEVHLFKCAPLDA